MVKNVSDIKKKTVKILKENDVARAGIFGSYARGEQKKGSDVDILIEFNGKKSLFDLAGLKIALEKALKKKVDVVTYASIHPLLKRQILKEEVRIYGEKG